jgi:hypothetical protein
MKVIVLNFQVDVGLGDVVTFEMALEECDQITKIVRVK